MDAYSKRSSSSSSSSSSATTSPGGVSNTNSKSTSSCSAVVAVAAGSVWETRMRSDEVKGGIKVFNGDEVEGESILNNAEAGERVSSGNGNSPTPRGTDKRMLINGGGKRKTWKSDQSSADGSIALISRSRSDQLLVNERSPVAQAKKGRMAVVSEKSSIQGRKLRSEVARSLPELRKVRSDSGKGKVGDAGGDSNSARSSAQLRKTKSEPENFVDEAAAETVRATYNGGTESGSDGICTELVVSEDKVGTNSFDQNTESSRIQSDDDNGDDDDGESTEDEEEEDQKKEIPNEEIEVKISEDVKEIIAEENAAIEEKKKKQAMAIKNSKLISANGNKQHQFVEKPNPIIVSTNNSANRQPPPPPSPSPESIKRTTTTTASSRVQKNVATPTPSKLASSDPIPRRTSTVRQNFVKRTSYEYERFPETQTRLQNLVDLVMWRDASRSAFVFGIGAFTIISSSYTRDLNISFITVISYLGLVYLAAIFLYRSIICRGYVDVQSTGSVLGEEEAIWLLKLVLPYLNEFLLKLRALFSGDPATTMKLAVLLFVMARCGSSITIWKMLKLGFFGAFTVPKVYSSYSTQISAYGKFWVRRFRDAWDSCSHKKAVAFGIFTLVWNLSSVSARIWAAFMLFVAFRYYQQSLVTEVDWGKDDGGEDATWQGGAGGPRRGCGPTIVEPTKESKAS